MEKRSEKGMQSKLNYINEYTNENYKTFGAKIKIEEYEVSNAIQWTSGRLIFDGEPLRDIIKDLERSYHVSITVKNVELYQLRFYGDFIRQEQSLTEVLDALSATGKFRYEKKNQQIIFY